MDCELKAPLGKFRVVGVDLFSHEDYVVGDYDSRAAAISRAETRNRERLGPMHDVAYVYDDQGSFIDCHLGQFGVHP